MKQLHYGGRRRVVGDIHSEMCYVGIELFKPWKKQIRPWFSFDQGS